MNKYVLILALLVLSSTTFLFRFHNEWSKMNNHAGTVLIQNGDSYTTSLLIKDDPQIYNYSARTIAQDQYIKRRVLVLSDSSSSQVASFKVGDSVQVKGYLLSLSPRQEYLEDQHVVGVFQIQEIINVKSKANVLEKTSEVFRSRISEGCSRLEKAHRGLCEGLLMGEQQNIEKQDYDNFKKAQLTHLVVASGSNIAFLVGFIQPLLSRFSIRSRTIAITALIITYCCATRFEPSILRASVMVILPAIALERGYRFSSFTIFVSTIVVSLNLDPFLIYRVGFWLSLFASGGLIFLSPIINRRISSELISNTLAATICVQPILYIAFGFKIPLLWWPSVIGVWVSEPITTIGMVSIMMISFLGNDQMLSELVVSIFQLGTQVLFTTTEIAVGPLGVPIGWGVSLWVIIAYTSRRRAKEIYYERQERHIHNRR